MLFHRGFEIAKPDRLQAHVSIVKILDRRLDEENFHLVSEIYNPSGDYKETGRIKSGLFPGRVLGKSVLLRFFSCEQRGFKKDFFLSVEMTPVPCVFSREKRAFSCAPAALHSENLLSKHIG